MRKIVAEIGSCGGDLSLAIDTAQAAIDAGAWMVKGQIYQADRLVTRTATTYGHDSIVEPATQWEAFEKALTRTEWEKVAESIPEGRFFASVFDLDACWRYPYPLIKIASADINYRALIETAAATNAQLIISTGAAYQKEVDQMRSWLYGHQMVLLACTLSYPTAPADAHCRRIYTLQNANVPVGYSDHTRGTIASAVAFDFGAVMVEKHFTITPGRGGDHDFAVTPTQLTAMADRRDPASDAATAVYGGSPLLGPRLCERPARLRARRSLHAAVDIPAESVITDEMVSVLRPGEGIEPWRIDEVRGVVTTRRIRIGEPILWDALS